MKRSHPPTLLSLARRTIADERLFAPGQGVVVAVSGGPDSMALLHVLGRLAPRLEIRLFAHGVDHGLRPEAGEELALARDLAESLSVPFATTRVRVDPGSNLMARARAARYEALRGALAQVQGDFIATAHHADDRAETLLLRLLRGTGPAGLAVLGPRRGDLVRPLIRARRSDILAHLTRHALRYAEDPTNRDPRFLRSRVRNELLPLMTQLSPAIVAHLCHLAEAAAPQRPGQFLAPARLAGRSLGRAQRQSLAQAFQNGNRAVRVPLKGGAVAGVDLCTGEIVLIEEEDGPTPRP